VLYMLCDNFEAGVVLGQAEAKRAWVQASGLAQGAAVCVHFKRLHQLGTLLLHVCRTFCAASQAGNRAAARLGLVPACRVIPVEPDEPHVTAAKELLKVQRQLASLGGSVITSATSRRTSGSSSTRRQQQQQVVGAAGSEGISSSSSSGSSGSWLSEASDSERRADASHELRELMIQEVGQQVAEQKRQEQQAP
jgi:hypothetical protein